MKRAKPMPPFQNLPQRTLSSQRELGFRIFHTLLSNCAVEKYISGQGRRGTRRNWRRERGEGSGE